MLVLNLRMFSQLEIKKKSQGMRDLAFLTLHMDYVQKLGFQ